MKRLLKLKLRKPKLMPAVITGIQFEQIKNASSSDLRAVVFNVCFKNNPEKQLTVGKAWLDIDGRKLLKYLWVSENATSLSKRSNIGKLLEYYNKESLQDLLKADVDLFPTYDNYIALAGCPMDAEAFNKTKTDITKEDFYA